MMDAAAPLWITPIVRCQHDVPDIGHYEILQRIVTEGPNDSEIETAIELFIGPDDIPLWKRVIVRSGPTCPQVVHASFPLADEDSLPTGNAICWAAFSDQPGHKFLCVLANPSLLCIWDVYPDQPTSVGEGHSIPLPFEASSIHAVQREGLLIQRIETFDDQIYFDSSELDEDDSGFVLKAPPRPVRTSLDTLHVPAMPSLFSLSHPLDDVLPVASITGVFSDVFEKIMFVGEVTGIDTTKGNNEPIEYQRTICVTYHKHKKRHAIWQLQPTPGPPPQAPLWQVSSHWRSNQGWNSHLGVLQQDLDDLELLGNTNVDNNHGAATRNDALADALGIRKTPRKAVDESKRRRSVTRSQPRPGKPTNSSSNVQNNNISLLSPVARPNAHTQDLGHTLMDVDTSVDSTARPALLTMGPFASLHPKLAMTCFYEDVRMTMEASRVFVASNVEGSGRTTVCLLCPGQEGLNRSTLRLFSLEHQHSGLFSIAPEVTFPCISALPIESSPVSPSFLGGRCQGFAAGIPSAVDILVLREIEGKQQLTLFRGCVPITDCVVRPVSGLIDDEALCDLEHNVGSRLDLVVRSNPAFSVRAYVWLQMTSGAIAEKILSTIESSIYSSAIDASSRDRAELALMIRSDCVRLEQHLVSSDCEGAGLEAIEAVVMAVFLQELKSQNINEHTKDDDQSSEPSSSAWQQLLQSKFHQSYEIDFPDFLFPAPLPISKRNSSMKSRGMKELSRIFSSSVAKLEKQRLAIAESMFRDLHLLYENYKVDCSARDSGLPAVGTILAKLCQQGMSVKSELFLHHYRRDMGETWFQHLGSSNDASCSPIERAFDVGDPFCILSWIDACLSSALDDENLSLDLTFINSACSRLKSLIRVFKELYSKRSVPELARDFAVVSILIEEGFRDQESLRDSLPPGVSLPLLEVLHRCRACLHRPGVEAEDPAIWSLIGREDLRMMSEMAKGHKHKVSEFHSEEMTNLEDNDLDGLCLLERTSAMLFPEDNRIKEVGRLLRSSRPVYLNVHRAIEVSDHDYERLKQEKLLLLSRRILALPLGRGMVTIGNLEPVPAEPLPLPELCLAGRVPPTNALLTLDTAECPSDLRVWPDFNNGVAAGLRLPLPRDAGELVSKITRTWIVFNRPSSHSQPNSQTPGTPPQQNLGHAHGGLLMALGLRGHLTTLEMTDIFDYLTHGTVTTTVGVLLGMAANMRGTCDISVSKMLCLHIPSLIPQHFSTIDVSSAVQAAAVSGAGLLYQGSSHRMMTEFLLNEIGKRPSNDMNVVDREAYTLSCGIALGMVNLRQGDADGRGTRNAGLADLRIEERLYRYIVGGLDDAEMRRKRDEGDRLSLPTTSASNGNEKCSCVYEGDSINTDITSPGATLALGLIYMMSGNKTIASAISLPDTHFLLEYVRPDFLMLRVIARALILWDDVIPSSSWIDSQLPLAVREAYEQMKEHAENLGQDKATSARIYKDFDRPAVRLIHAHVIAGACFSIGLRFAGTGDRRAVSAILERVLEFKDLRDGTLPVSCALRPPVAVLEMCLGCAALSLSMVLAGTGDLEALRLLKVLRWRCDENINYGSHMAFGAAIGLLFLGGGTCTLGRDPADIAALVLAFYPRFPATTSDNQYHLQALRNLYALAVKCRTIRAIDVDTRENVFVPIEVRYDKETIQPLKLTTPCILTNTDARTSSIHVVSERYYPVNLTLSHDTNGNIFFVKRRRAHLSYKQDPESKRSLLVQTGSLQGGCPLELVVSFTDDKAILAFAKHFCGIGESGSSCSVTDDPFCIEGFCQRVLFESLMHDTQEALPLYLVLRNAVDCVDHKYRSMTFIAWDFRLIRSYYTFRHLIVDESKPVLLNSEIVTYLYELVERTLNSRRCKQPALLGPMTILYDHPLPIESSIESDDSEMDLS